MKVQTKTQKFRLRQQLEDRKEHLELLVAEMERRGDLDMLVAPFRDDLEKVNANLEEFRRVYA